MSRVDTGRTAPTLGLAAARTLHLAAQGLLHGPRRRARKPDVLAAIVRMQLLQIDTIHVVARSPWLVLYSRLGAYPPHWLDELLAEGAIFETWAHEACLAPMADWALLHQHAQAKDHHWATRSARRTYGRGEAGMRRILDHIREHGPMRSADFREGHGRRGSWWGWKDGKRWLEAWFALGELMVARRENFQRVYDITDRVLARAGIDRRAHVPLPPDALRRELVERSVKALGVVRPAWVADYYRLGHRVTGEELDALVEAGRLCRVHVRGLAGPAYVHAGLWPLARAAAEGRLRPSRTTVLSPFDPVVWDRRRASELFGFDYRLECYVPPARRQFGYFVLPILHRGRLCGRLDAKAHREDGVFEVRRLALEPDLRPGPTMCASLARMLWPLARWHGCSAVRLVPGAAERGLQGPLAAAIRAVAQAT